MGRCLGGIDEARPIVNDPVFEVDQGCFASEVGWGRRRRRWRPWGDRDSFEDVGAVVVVVGIVGERFEGVDSGLYAGGRHKTSLVINHV